MSKPYRRYLPHRSKTFEHGTMKPPKLFLLGKKREWRRPSFDWLAFQYKRPPEGLGKPASTIAREVGCNRNVVEGWLHETGLGEPHSVRHSFRMAGENNPEFKGHSSRHGQKSRLHRSGRPVVCEWCGGVEEKHHNMHLHHRDHNTKNGSLENLAWLCYYCNLLEAMLFRLTKAGRVHWKVKDGSLLVKFLQANKPAKQVESLEDDLFSKLVDKEIPLDRQRPDGKPGHR